MAAEPLTRKSHVLLRTLRDLGFLVVSMWFALLNSLIEWSQTGILAGSMWVSARRSNFLLPDLGLFVVQANTEQE